MTLVNLLLEFKGFDDFIKKLIPSWIDFVVQIIALVIIIVAIIIFAYKPVKKIITERQDYIEKNIVDSEQAKATYEANVRESNEMIIASRKTASEIIESAKTKGEEQQQQMILSAEQEIAHMKKVAEQDIKQSEQEALKDIHNEMVNVALDASKEILKREINEKDNARIVEDFIEEL